MTTVVWSCAAGLSLACYTYVPVSLDGVAPGATVRALISTEAQFALRDSLGLTRQTVQGTLVDRDGDRVLLAVRSDGGERRAEPRALYQRVALAQRDVLQVGVKRLQKGRTVGLIASLAAAATVLTVRAIKRGNAGRPNPPGGGPPE